MIERVDRLTTPPVVGRWYLVRTLTYQRFVRGAVRTWPIIGPKHTDQEFFNFQPEHYHVDVRFLNQKHLRLLQYHWCYGALEQALAQPCSAATPDRPLQPVEWKRMQCRRLGVRYPYFDKAPVQDLNAHYKGKQALKSKRGWLCPHRRVALGTQIADKSGIITCPLHGLRINAKTGKCMGPLHVR